MNMNAPCSILRLFVYAARAFTTATTFGIDPEADYRESFEGGFHLDWTVVRDDMEHRSFTRNPGQLTITTQRGTIHRDADKDVQKTGGAARNIFLLDKPIPDGVDFDAILEVTRFSAKSKYHQVALIFYKDDDNYVKWSMAYAWRDGGGNNLVLVRESNAIPAHGLIQKKEIGGKFWLKIARSGDRYVCSYSEDGRDYELIGLKEWITGDELDAARIGFLAKNGGDPDAEEIDAVINSFELKVFPAK
jgi:regulation of enolase protein 1 (concanavalin A-like superfamily)